MSIEPSIFKAYDIRGIYPTQLDEDTAYAIGRAYATLLRKENPEGELTIAVGSDMRVSSPSLKERVIAGLIDSGIHVDDMGLVSTPTFYFGVGYFGYGGGLQVSASHNPAEWNGVKIVRAKGLPVSGPTGIYEIRDIIIDDAYIPLASIKGVLKERTGVLAAEVEHFVSLVDVSKIKPLKVVIDASNAMGALDYAALFEKLPCEVIKMNFELDGTFPAHEADPFKEENVKELQERIRTEHADVGIAPDGDGDRVFYIDELGNTMHPAIMRGLMAQIELKENPGATVAYDIRPGRITRDMIEECGGKSIVTPVGHSLIKEIMLQHDAVFGGESSGHFFFRLEYGTYEAPLLFTLKLLIYISEQQKTFSEVIHPFMRYAHSGEINTKVGSKEEVQERIHEIQTKYSDGTQTFIDGVSVEYPDVWFNMRGSNTEPVIRVTVEGKTKVRMETVRDELLSIVRR